MNKKYLFSVEKFDENVIQLKIDENGSSLSSYIKKYNKYYFTILLNPNNQSNSRIGIHSNLEGKYALSFHEKKGNQFPDKNFLDACNVRWKKFQTEKTTVNSVQKIIEKFFLVNTFK